MRACVCGDNDAMRTQVQFLTRVRIRSISLLFFFAIAALGANEASAQQSDTKLWAGFSGKVPILKPLRLSVDHQQRLSSNNGVERALTEFELRLKVVKFLKLGVAYRIISTAEEGFWHRGIVNVGLGH